VQICHFNLYIIFDFCVGLGEFLWGAEFFGGKNFDFDGFYKFIIAHNLSAFRNTL
jgi:hypothetical protein